ncbi:MAG: 3-dehydroquinate synthase [Candidatus Delongbacteria bacterium]|jgi:3-dehydroquinate synthase|nr:3-dehydroquinate synthase [Candidatus Delongbacteria bacterium]
MKTITLNTSNKTSKIFIGAEFANIRDHIDPDRVIIVTDENVHSFYEDKFKGYRTITISIGENIKSFKTVEYIIEKLIEFKADRNTFLLGVGGGVVTDITGFVASIYLRGIDFGFVSTSLLSQVDASIGGKNGVNFKGLKNIIGVFNQPEFVICDISMLRTLPERDVRSGLGELIKHGVIGDPSILELLDKNYERINSLDREIMEELLFKSISVKSKIVKIDERESGLRKTLNFGHTIGHAIELAEDLTHGEAISIGMATSLGISVEKCYINTKVFIQIKKLLKKYGLPTDLPSNIDDIMETIKFDKKNEKDGVNFILLKGLGKASIEKMDLNELKTLINKL